MTENFGGKDGCPQSDCFFFQSPFNLREVVTACKNQLIPSVHSWDTVNFRVRDQIGYTQFLPSPTKTFSIKFQILWICINMQKMRLSSICSGEIVDLNSLQSDWLRAFWPISQEQDFQDLWRNTANKINLHYRTTSVAIKDHIFL